MMMALVTIFLLAILSGELVYQSGVYSGVVFRARDQLRATLLARSGLRLARLQLVGAKKAKAQAKTMGLGDNNAFIDKIWQTPLVLPPPVLPGLTPTETSTLETFRSSLKLEGVVSTTIRGENERISINQIIWPFAAGAEDKAKNPDYSGATPTGPDGKPLPSSQIPKMTAEDKKELLKQNQTQVAEILQNILEKRRQDDDAFRDKYPSLTGEQLMGNLLAWMDPKTLDDGDHRNKEDYYQRAEPEPYALKNAPMVSESEYHMVKGFDDEIAKLMEDNFTMQPTNSVDVNKVTMTLLHSLIPELNNDALERIDKRRKDESLGGPFKDEKDFWGYLETLGNFDEAKKRFTDRGLKILSSDTTYYAVITAQSGSASKVWLAKFGALPPNVEEKQANTFQPGQPPPQPSPSGTSTSTNTNTNTTVSSDMDSLNIVYLKAD